MTLCGNKELKIVISCTIFLGILFDHQVHPNTLSGFALLVMKVKNKRVKYEAKQVESMKNTCLSSYILVLTLSFVLLPI